MIDVSSDWLTSSMDLSDDLMASSESKLDSILGGHILWWWQHCTSLRVQAVSSSAWGIQVGSFNSAAFSCWVHL